MKHTALKRLLALTLAVVMVLGLGVTGVSADDGGSKGLSYEKLDRSEISAQLMDTSTTLEETGPALYEDDELVRVTIVMEGLPAAAQMEEGLSVEGIRSDLRAAQTQVAQSISAQALDGEELDVVWNLTLVSNAISANVEYGQIEKIKQVDGVASVQLETKYMPLGNAETTNIVAQTMTGANAVQNSGYTGAGTRVAIIDTGVDTDHQSFAEAPFLYAMSEWDGAYDLLDKDEIAEVLQQLNIYQTYDATLTAEDLYINSKIPFGYNYIDLNTDITHDNDTQGEHGSHVAGIAAANRYISAGGPNASLDDFAQYDFDGDGNFDLDDVQALMDHVILGAEIANLANADISADGKVSDYDVHLFLDLLGETYLDAAKTVGVTGVAPDAQIVAMKVFGAAGGAYQSDYTAAIEDAVLLGCDSINLSLGASYPGFSHSYTYLWYDEVIDALKDTDVVVCVSAGNSYSWADNDDAYGLMYADEGGTTTTTDPSTYTNTLSVASADNVGYVSDVLTVAAGEELVFSAETVSYGKNAPWTSLDPNGTGTTYEAIFLGDPSGLLTGGAQNDVTIYGDNGDFTKECAGKIVFVARGNGIAFTDKHMNAAAVGAAAIVIYNNVPGTIYMSLADSSATIPCGVVALDEAKTIFQKFTKNENGVYTGSFTVTSGLNVNWGEETASVTMSDFSSWGAIGDLSIKPEVTAPGGGIYSVNGADKSGTAYEVMSGTSMASPHAAGIAALSSQYIRESGLAEKTGFTTRQLIHSLMMSTAEPILEEGTGVEYSVRNQGAGLVNIRNMVAAQSFVMVDGQPDGKIKAELGDGTEARSFTFTLYNHSSSAIVYDLSASILTPGTTTEDGHQLTTNSMTVLDADVTFSTGRSITVDANSSKSVTVTIAVSDETAAELAALGHTNGFYMEGYVYAKARATREGVQDVTHSIPLLGWYGSWTDISMYDTGSYIEMYYGTQERPSHIQNAIDGDGYEADTTQKNMLAWAISDYVGYASYPYSGNIYGRDTSYIEARNAINVTSDRYWQIYAICPTLIRNAIDADLFVTDENGNVLYWDDCDGYQMYANYYLAAYGRWLDFTNSTGSIIDDWSWAEDLPEGTRLTFTLGMVPEYYAEDDKYFDGFAYSAEYGAELYSGYEIDNAWWTDGTIGDGAFLRYSFTVDNTAPELSGENALRLEDGKLSFTAQDNRYIATVILLDNSGARAVEYYYPDMAEDQIGQAITGSFDLTGYTGSRAVLAVCDYAGNETYYSVNLNGEQGESYADLVAFQYGDGWYNDLAAWVTFDSNVNKNEISLYNEDVIEMVCAEYINGYIFAQDSNGKLYGINYQDFLSGAITDLETTYITTLKNVYQDLAYSYKEGKLYGLLTTVYDDYPTSEILSINLKGSYYDEDLWRQVEAYEESSALSRGGLYGLGMAIDDNGTVYVMGPTHDWDTEEMSETAHLWSVGVEYNEWTFKWELGWQMTEIGDTGLPMDYLQSMTWDHNTGALYWAQFSSPKEAITLQKVDPETAKCEQTGVLSTETCAMFAPLTAETAAKEEYANVPTFDSAEIGAPILSAHALTMGKNTTQTLSVNFEPWYTGHKDVVWFSDDETVATVDQNGKVTAVGEGSCTVTVVNLEDETKLDTCQITVASLSANIEGIVSFSDTNIADAGSSHYYEFQLQDGEATMTHGTSFTATGELEGYGTKISAAVIGRNGNIWASEWANQGMFYEIDPETMEALDVIEPVGGGFTYGMSYSRNTDCFTTIANYDMFVDLALDHAMEEEMKALGENFMSYHRIDMEEYLMASDEGFDTGETSTPDYDLRVVLCGITDIDEPYTYEMGYDYKDYLGEMDYNKSGVNYAGINYTSATTHVLLDNVGRLWYIDEIPGFHIYQMEYEDYDWQTGEPITVTSTYYYTADSVEAAMDGEGMMFESATLPNGMFFLEETDEDGTSGATGFYIRELQETPLTDMFRAGTMPRYSYNFSDIYYAGKTEDGAPMFFLSLYDFWNSAKTNQFYLYVGGTATGEWDSETDSEIMTPSALYSLGNSGDCYVIATITSAEYLGGLPETEDNTAEATGVKSYVTSYNFKKNS